MSEKQKQPEVYKLIFCKVL